MTTTVRDMRAVLIAATIGAGVAISIGVYGRTHQPTGDRISTFGAPDVLTMKAWGTTLAAVLAIVQLVSALWMWRRLPGAGATPSWVAHAHRWSGTVAFLASLPVAYHCLWSLGFRTTDARVVAHSLLGCAFYGVFVTKMLALRSDRMPRLALPLLGGGLVVLLTAIWLTSSLWFFTNFGLTSA
jgi:Family of unknown function (DUF6529)